MAVGILGTAVSGLQAFQRGISVAGHNISNANTDGYSRQRVELGTRPPGFTGAGFVGNGVQIDNIQRMFDEFAVTNLRNTTSSSSQYDTLALFSGRISNLLSDEHAGLNGGLENFFNAVQNVADDPSSMPARQLMLAESESLTGRFRNLDAQLDSMTGEINSGLGNIVSEINGLSNQIADINKSIVDVSNQSNSERPNDLLDRRDQLIARLSELVSVRTIEQDNGAVNVFVGTGQSLVTGFLSSQLSTAPNNFDASRLEIAINNGPIAAVITGNLTGGKLGATLDFRDQMLDPVKNALGRIAVALGTEFNRQHSLGMDLDGANGADFFAITAPVVAANVNNAGAAVITASFDNANIDDLTTENYILAYDGVAWSLSHASDGQAVAMSGAGPYFADGIRIDIAGGAAAGDRFLIQPTESGAAGISTLISNAREIAAAAPAAGPAPGDNRNALLLADLQNSQSMEGGTTNFQGAYAQLVGKLGTQTRSAQINAEAQAALLSQAQATRDTISGVNLDEEAADLLRFQQAYQAIAQVISVADSTFQTLLSAVRR
ncbi:MAG: flagellar hook-associated protein FlgK [Thiogranum sp.]|nr:flagellar hook-associated protein FlgK [Thiogranum sp.]